MQKLRAFLSTLALYALATFLLLPSFGLSLASVTFEQCLPFFPLLLYSMVGLYCWNMLTAIPRDQIQASLSPIQAMSLTLTGFCFTSMGFLLSFFKEEIKQKNPAPEAILYFFAIALACFIASYMTLRYRHRHLFLFMFDAFMDNGLWCILVGLLKFAARTPGLTRLSAVFKFFVGGYFLYLGTHFLYTLRARPQAQKGHGGGHS
jgi:hypothetical protein